MKPFITIIIAAAACLIQLSACASQNSITPHIKVDTANLYASVQRLTSSDPPRNYYNPDSLEAVAQYIKETFTGYGLSTTEQAFDVNDTTCKNIIASYGPADSPVLVIGAHYDVHGDLPGADDNASGVAGLVELARLVSLHRPALDYRIEFVAYTLEEPPFFRTENMGSYIHARSLHDAGVDVIGMICLEMIGYFSDSEESQQYPLSLLHLFYPDTGDFIAVISNFSSSDFSDHLADSMELTPIKTEQLSAPAIIPGIDFSDHMNYWKFDYDAVMITDTAFYRNPNYHKPSDTIDTLNFDMMAWVVQGVYISIINLKP